MNSRNVLLVLLFTISILGTVYTFMLFFGPQNILSTHVQSYSSPSVMASSTVRYTYSIVPPSLTVLAWLATGYEIFAVRRRDIFLTIKKEMAGELEKADIKYLFNKRGSGLRLSIIGSLGSPRLRNELARETGADWKEIDRNVRILTSVGLIHVKNTHGPIAEYELTGKGHMVYEKIKSSVDTQQ